MNTRRQAIALAPGGPMANDVKRVRTRLIDLAQKDVRKGNFVSALRRYKRLTGLEPENPTFQLKLGDLSARIDKPEAAMDCFLRAGTLFSRDGFDDKAIAVYRQALKVDPGRHEIRGEIATTYGRMGRIGDAISSLEEAVKSLQKAGQADQALTYRRRIARLDPGDTDGRCKLAEELSAAGLVDESLREYVEISVEYSRSGALSEIPGIFDTILELKPEEISELEQLSDVLDSSESDSAVGEGPARHAEEDAGDVSEMDQLLAKVHLCRAYQENVQSLYQRLAEIYRESAGPGS